MTAASVRRYFHLPSFSDFGNTVDGIPPSQVYPSFDVVGQPSLQMDSMFHEPALTGPTGLDPLRMDPHSLDPAKIEPPSLDPLRSDPPRLDSPLEDPPAPISLDDAWKSTGEHFHLLSRVP